MASKTAKQPGPYSAVLAARLDAEIVPEERTAFVLRSMARDIDEARAAVIESATYAARNLTELASNYSAGRCYTSNPLSSSVLYDLPMLIARHDAAQKAFWNMIEAVAPDALRPLREELRGA